MKWTDLDFTMGVITITMSKSGKGRKIPMSGAVAEALGAVPRRGEFVFWNEETKDRLKDVKGPWAAACSRAKITGVRLHDCRHTALSTMIRNGADIATVQKIAGHSSILMTSRYLHPTGESMRLAVEGLGGILDPSRRKADTPSQAVSTAPSVSASNSDN